jgi:hypothetical protein
MIFLLEVIGLALLGALLFSLVITFVRMVRGLLIRKKVSFCEAWVRIWRKFFADNNRRWEYLLAMTIIALFVAIANPGPPMLFDSIAGLPSQLFGDSGATTAKGFVNHLLFGKDTAKYIGPHQPNEGSWFWMQVFWMFALGTFIYTFFAFSDEVTRGINAVRERWGRRAPAPAATPPPVPPQTPPQASAQVQQGRRRRRGQQQVPPPTPPPPATAPLAPAPAERHITFPEILGIGMIGDALWEIGGEIFRGWRKNRGGRS